MPLTSSPAYDVGVLTTSFPRFAGDLAGNFVYFCCRELTRRGLKVAVVAPHHAGTRARETLDGIDVTRFRYLCPPSLQKVAYGSGILPNLRRSWLARLTLPFFILSFWLHARHLARSCRILHAHWIPSGLIGLTCSPFRRPPLVISVWGSDLNLLRTRLLGRLTLSLLRRAEALVAVSGKMKEQLVDLGIPAEKIAVVLTAVSPLSRPALSREELRRRLGLPLGRPIALYLGRLSPEKGPHHLVEAARIAIRQAPEAYFVFAGDGQLRPHLEAAVEADGLRDHFLFAGFIPHDQVGSWLAAADLLVLPSLSEGLPHAVIEAMDFGLPVVASAVGGVPEIVQEGVSGYLVPPGDAIALAERILRMLCDPELRTTFGQAGGRMIQERQLNWERFATEVLGVYQNLQHEPIQGSGVPS